MDPRGRFAPSPTGELHLGNLRTALLAWLWARSSNGGFTLRIEDLDRPRCKAELAERQLADLRWLGLDWDEGPEHGSRGPYRQSERAHLYDEAIERLRIDGRVYECFCSRAQIRAAQGNLAPGNASGGAADSRSKSDSASSEASAPHGPQDDGPRYPGTCAHLSRDEIAERRRSRPPALRLRVPPGPVSFDDAIQGAQQFDPSAEVGDFVLRRADGIHAYQLAVVVDDAAMGITQALRGKDLLPSTARQILLYRLLGLDPPRWAHAPLLRGQAGADGKPERMSKRSGEGAAGQLRARGVAAAEVVAALARSANLLGPGVKSCAPRELVGHFSLAKIALSHSGDMPLTS